MNVSQLRNLAVRHFGQLLAAAPAPTSGAPVAVPPTRRTPVPTMALDRWGTILEVGQSRVGDKYVLGRLRFRTDDGAEHTFLVERGSSYLSFFWLDDRGAWQRRRASFHELKPGMRAEVWGEAGVAEAVMVEGLPRVTA